MIRPIRLALCVVFVVAAASAGACNKGTAPVAEAKPPKVTVMPPVFAQTTDEDSYTGWLRPMAEVEVRARVRGHIQQVDFKDGDMVEKKQLLFELDPRPFQSKIDEAI